MADEPGAFDEAVDRGWESFHRAVVAGLKGPWRQPAPARLHWGTDDNGAMFEPAAFTVRIVASSGGIALELIGDLDSSREAEPLAALGWQVEPDIFKQSGPTYFLNATAQFPPRHTQQVARFLSQTIRDVFNIPHPSLLRYEINGEQPFPVAAIEASATRRIWLADSSFVSGPEVVFPTSEAELEESVERAITSKALRIVERSAAGDLTVRTDRGPIGVRVRADLPAVVLSYEVDGVDRLPWIDGEVTRLNEESRWARYRRDGETLHVQFIVAAAPFVPVALRRSIGEFMDLTRSLADSFEKHFLGLPIDRGGAE